MQKALKGNQLAFAPLRPAILIQLLTIMPNASPFSFNIKQFSSQIHFNKQF